jgi:hypothetical protein
MSVYRPKKWIQLNPLSSSGGAYSEGQRGMPSVLILDNTPLGRQYGVQPRRNDEGTFISLTTKPGHNLGLTTRYQTAPTIYLGFDFEADRLIGAKEIAFIRGGNLAGGGAATTFSVARADSEIAAGRTLMKSVQGRTSTPYRPSFAPLKYSHITITCKQTGAFFGLWMVRRPSCRKL